MRLRVSVGRQRGVGTWATAGRRWFLGALPGVGFVPMIFTGGAVRDTHKLDSAYPVGASKLVGGTQGSGLMALLCARESLDKEVCDEIADCTKPCIGTQRVTNPARQSGPAAGSESCVVVGQPRLRSVDSEWTGLAIQPRD